MTLLLFSSASNLGDIRMNQQNETILERVVRVTSNFDTWKVFVHVFNYQEIQCFFFNVFLKNIGNKT